MRVAVVNLKGGVGKALAETEPVLTPSGFRQIGSLQRGDLVVGSDGCPYEVLGVYPQGERDLYRVTLSDGTSISADADHIWEVQRTSDRGRGTCEGPDCRLRVISGGLCPGHLFQKRQGRPLRPLPSGGSATVARTEAGNRLMTTAELLADGLGEERPGRGRRHKWFIPVCRPVRFGSVDLPIDPYLLGLLLGDGAVSTPGVTFTTAEPEVKALRSGLPASLEARAVGTRGYSVSRPGGLRYADGDLLVAVRESGAATRKDYLGWREQRSGDAPCANGITARSGSYRAGLQLARNGVRGGRPGRSRHLLAGELRRLGLGGVRGADSFVPDIYKLADPDARLAVLQGLLDTDGWVEGAAARFSTASSQLADDVQFIAQTVGCVVTRAARPSAHRTVSGELRPCQVAHRLRIQSPPGVRLFRLARKQELLPEGRRPPYRAITSIEAVGRGQAVCIEVASPDRLYLARNCVPTHNTITSVHLASGLAQKGRVLLVDADPYSSSSRWAERVGEGFPCEVVELSGRDLHWQLPAMAKGFVHVVIDTPPNDEAVARSAMLAAEVVVIPVGPSPMDMDRLTDTLELVGEVRETIRHPLQVRVLLTRVRSGTRSSRMAREELAGREVPVLLAEVPLREAYARAFGSPPAPHVDYGEVLAELIS